MTYTSARWLIYWRRALMGAGNSGVILSQIRAAGGFDTVEMVTTADSATVHSRWPDTAYLGRNASSRGYHPGRDSRGAAEAADGRKSEDLRFMLEQPRSATSRPWSAMPNCC